MHWLSPRRSAVVAAVLLGGCATAPPQPSSVERGMVVGRVVVRGALFRFLTSRAEEGELRMLDAAGAPIPDARVRSSLALGDGYFAFVDLPAGRYELVAAAFRARGVRYLVTFPESAEEKKRTLAVRPGAAAFAGAYVFDGIWPERDVALARLARIALHWITPWMARPLLPRDAALRGEDPSPAAEASAMRAASAGLAGTEWRSLAERRLRELGAPDPVKRTGLLLRRDIPLKREPLLGWRDTLSWGPPRRWKDRLEWRRPGGEARLAVFFTTATAPGFAGWEAAQRELRRDAAESVEDVGDVYEVRVGTRAGVAARKTSYVYPDGTLTGSVTKVIKTETVLVPDGYGLLTVRLRAPRGEFESVAPEVHEFLRQMELGPPPVVAPKQEIVLPFAQ